MLMHYQLDLGKLVVAVPPLYAQRSAAGVSDNAMKHIHQFTSEYRMCEPERVKPAIKRRRGESPVDWLAVSLSHEPNS